MNRLLCFFIFVFICTTVRAQFTEWSIGIYGGSGRISWDEFYNSTGVGQGHEPTGNGAFQGSGKSLSGGLLLQYRIGHFRVGPSFTVNEFHLGLLTFNGNDSQHLSPARPAASERATTIGVGVGYIVKLARQLELGLGVEGGRLHLSQRDDWFENKIYYRVGADLMLRLEKWTPMLKVTQQKLMFDFKDIDYPPSLTISQEVEAKGLVFAIGVLYNF